MSAFQTTRTYRRVIAFDSETYKIRPGLMAPPVVCGTFAERINGEVRSSILLGPLYLEELRRHLLNPDVLLVAANTAFDAIVAISADETLVPLVFQKYADDGFRDVQIRQKLLDIAQGRIDQHGKMFVERGGEFVPATYSLASLVSLYLGKDRWEQKKAPDAWRLRYAELDGVPLDQWPKEAIDYALEDAIDALLVFEAQGGQAGDMPTEGIQNRAAFALDLQTAWGIRSDRDFVEALEKDLLEEQARVHRRLKKIGFLVKEPMTPAQVRDEPDKVAGEMTITKVKSLTLAQKKALEKGNVPENVEVLTEDVLEQAGRPEGFFVDTYAQVLRKTVPFKWKKNTTKIKSYVQRVYGKKGMDAPTTAGREVDGVRVPEVATDKDTLKQSGSRLLGLVADGGGVDKLIQTYLPVLKRGLDVPINARYEVLVNSGRTSAKSWTDEDGQVYGFNIQNLPTARSVFGKRIREAFVARQGWLFSFSDYKTLELCTLAQVQLRLFGHSVMADAINEGKDLHTLMASVMLGIPYEEAVDAVKVKGSPAKKARDAAKAANFGYPGGLGVESFLEFARATYGVILNEQQARDLKRFWQQTFPECGTLLTYVGNLVGVDRVTLEHPITGFIRGKVGYCDGNNHMFQHPAAVGAKIALFDIAWECYVPGGREFLPYLKQNIGGEPSREEISEAMKVWSTGSREIGLDLRLYGCRPVAFIHDEIGIEVPRWKAAQASERQGQIMVSAFREITPDVKITAVPTLMARWYKEAEDVYCEQGHVIEWTPEVGKKIKDGVKDFPCQCPGFEKLPHEAA